MARIKLWFTACLIAVCCMFPTSVQLLAQSSVSGKIGTNAVVPPLVKFIGTLTDINGKPLSGMVGVSFYLYQEQQGGSPLWMETQNVRADNNGRYTVMLGSTTNYGLPSDLFVSGDARWLGVQAQGQPEQPRVWLLSVPYALKAADAQTLGGLPASAFLLAAPNGSNGVNAPGGVQNNGNSANIGGSGTQDFIPIWMDGSGDLGNSILYQSHGNEVGIGTTTPAATLDVNGGIISRGSLQLPSTGTANASQGFNSQPLDLQGSAFNSGTEEAISPTFQWQTEPSGNNSSSPSGTLNLLYGSGSGKPSETGLNIASNGQITFASGQAFPGAGTITGVKAGTGLSGGGTSGTVTLSINTNFANQFYAQLGAANTFTKNQTVNGTMTATSFTGNGSLLTNVNASELGGLPPSSYQPAGSYATTGANNFTGNQNVTGNIMATGSISGAAGNFTGLVTEAGALLPAAGTATASQGFNSQPMDSVASSFNSGTGKAANQDFRWLAEPVGNNTNSPSAKLNLLFGVNGGAPSETGLSVASNGQIAFASGQTFPNVGTVTSVGTGAGLTGGPITGTGSISIAPAGITNAMLANPSLTVTAGTGLTGGGTVALGGSTTLNIDPTQVPLLSANNVFTGSETVNGNLATGGVVIASGFEVSNYPGFPFAFANSAQSTYLGLAGNPTTQAAGNVGVGANTLFVDTTGQGNTIVGANAMTSNTTGSTNTTLGQGTMASNSTGSQNVAIGNLALTYNFYGNQNTAVGAEAMPNNNTGNNLTCIGAKCDVGADGLTNATAIGAYAQVAQSNSLVLGGTGTNAVNVGIGTAYPWSTLTVQADDNGSTRGGPHQFVIQGASSTAKQLLVGYLSDGGSDAGYAMLQATDQGAQNTPILLNPNGGGVGIQTTTVTNSLTIGQGQGAALADGWNTYSSRRWKTNIKTLPDALSKVEQLRGVSYDLKESGKHEIGVIAEEVGAVVPEIVQWDKNRKDANGVDYTRLTALLIEAVKQQQREIAHAARQIRQQQALLRQQTSRIRALEATVYSVDTSHAKTTLALAQPMSLPVK
ncbi:MAG TPA: tail fiber domain-containing protein [Terriglobales bacterium]|nr:tail fiber domain-containing protein [Terriglobales bacterium]